MRINLHHYELASLKELAPEADHLIARLNQDHKSQLTPYPGKEPSYNQSFINEVLKSRLNLLQRSVSKLSESESYFIAKPLLATQVLSHGSQHYYSKPSHRNSSPQLRQRGQPRLCYYHSRFGDRTWKCEGPPASEELLPLHLLICTTFCLLLSNLLTTAYFSSLTTFSRLAF